MAYTTGFLSSLWVQLQPPFAADVTLSGSIRLERAKWEFMEKELIQGPLKINQAVDPITNSHDQCPIEIVQLVTGDRKDNAQDIVKYRVRRVFSALNPDETPDSLLRGRLTYGKSIAAIWLGNDALSIAMARLWKLAKQIDSGLQDTLLGSTKTAIAKYQMEPSHNRNDRNDRNNRNNRNNHNNDPTGNPPVIPLSKDSQVSAWGEGESSMLRGKRIATPQNSGNTSTKNGSPSPFQPGSSAINEMPRHQFLACYVATWRILIGTLIHLDVVPARNQRNRSYKQRNTTIPRRQMSKRSGNWLGLHKDYRSRAVDQSLCEFSMFARGSHSIKKSEFNNFFGAIFEMNCINRTAKDFLSFLQTIELGWKEMFKASHTVSYRLYPSKLLHDPHTVGAALSMMTNDGTIVAPSMQSSSAGSSKVKIGLKGNELVRKETDQVKSAAAPSTKKPTKEDKHTFHRGGGRAEANRNAVASLSNDRYLRPECHRYTIGRRTAITPVPEDRSKTPGPGTYTPFSSYPFQHPFGSHGNTQGFPFGKSQGRTDSPRTRERNRLETLKCRENSEKHPSSNKWVDRGSTLERNNHLRARMDRNQPNQSNEARRNGGSNRSNRSSAVGRKKRTPTMKPQTAQEYKERLCQMSVLGMDESRWSLALPLALHAMPTPSPQQQQQVRRRKKESMATMCHPHRHQRIGQKNRKSVVVQPRMQVARQSSSRRVDVNDGWGGEGIEETGMEEEDEEDEIHGRHSSSLLPQVEIALSPHQLAAVYSHRPTIVDDAMNILYQGDTMSTPFQSQPQNWNNQKSSAKAMVQAFAARNDMALFARASDPHTDREHSDLTSCRLNDGECTWENEVEKVKTAPRVQGCLEMVLIERSQRKAIQRKRYST